MTTSSGFLAASFGASVDASPKRPRKDLDDNGWQQLLQGTLRGS
ncbi:MAG: hypothetical protein R3C17_16530 [Planctomycetaceae bacterium]